MIERKYLIASVAIIVAFAIGLVAFFAFSADKPDGLEDVMEDNGIEEGEPIWQAPFDYGDDYMGALFAGIIGFLVVFLVLFAYLRIVAKRKSNEEKK